MSLDQVMLAVRTDAGTARIEATRVIFSPHQCFRFDDGDEDRQCIDMLADHLVKEPGLALYGAGPLLTALARFRPDVIKAAVLLVVDPEDGAVDTHGLPIAAPSALPDGVR